MLPKLVLDEPLKRCPVRDSHQHRDYEHLIAVSFKTRQERNEKKKGLGRNYAQ